jgi:hypothetical protein
MLHLFYVVVLIGILHTLFKIETVLGEIQENTAKPQKPKITLK